MKPVDEQIKRLLHSAAAAPTPPSQAAPFSMEARVMGQWRTSLREDAIEFFEPWFKRAAICGCMLALASMMWTIHERHTVRGGVLAVADSAMSMGVEP